MSSVTFSLSGVEPGKPIDGEGTEYGRKRDEEYEIEPYNIKQCLYGKPFYNEAYDKVIETSQNENAYLISGGYKHGLINAIYTAYCNHTPLRLRPDDLWSSIVIILGKYINNNKELRSKIMKADEKIHIKVDRGDGSINWIDVTEEIMHQLQAITNYDIVELIRPNFTTTTDKDRLIASISLMSGLRKKTSFSIGFACGISQVTLEGTEDDWNTLILKAEKIRDLEDEVLNNWVSLLIVVLKKIHDSYSGNVDEEFWQRICTSIPRGSGGEQLFKGWFLVFCPFSTEGKYVLRTFEEVEADHIYGIVSDDEIPSADLDIDISLDNGESVTLYGGLLATEYDENNNIIFPRVDYMVIKSETVTIDILKEEYRKLLNKFSWSKVEKFEDAGIYDLIVDLAHYLMVTCNVPNNIWLNTMRYVYDTTSYRDKDVIPEKVDVVKKLYEKLSSEYTEAHIYLKDYNLLELIENCSILN